MARVADDHAGESFNVEHLASGKLAPRTITREEVKQHSSASGDFWAVIDGFVVDASDMVNTHPGGLRKMCARIFNVFAVNAHAHPSCSARISRAVVRVPSRAGSPPTVRKRAPQVGRLASHSQEAKMRISPTPASGSAKESSATCAASVMARRVYRPSRWRFPGLARW